MADSRPYFKLLAIIAAIVLVVFVVDCATVVIWLRSIDSGVGTKDDDDDRRVAVGSWQSVVGSR